MFCEKKCKRRDIFIGLSGLSTLLAGSLAKRLLADEPEKSKFGERMIERYPDFNDARSKKVMFVAQCILNQNARINSCAYTPAAIPKIPECLFRRNIGIIQMPCPELGILGLGRGGKVEIYDQLSTPGARRQLGNMAMDIVYQARQYQKQGFRVLGVLGIDGSPSCGVDLTFYEKEKPGRGAYIEELSEALDKAGLKIPVKGVMDAKPDEAEMLIASLDSE
jgi:predicted secreted protein